LRFAVARELPPRGESAGLVTPLTTRTIVVVAILCLATTSSERPSAQVLRWQATCESAIETLGFRSATPSTLLFQWCVRSLEQQYDAPKQKQIAVPAAHVADV
jgi:hypothetical protein